HAEGIHPRAIETANVVVVSLDPQDDVLPRHVFHAYTNRPTAGELGEIDSFPGSEIPCAGGYPHTSPADLGVKHRVVPSVTNPRGDGANLVDANGPLAAGRKNAWLRLLEVAPRPGTLETENQAVPLVLAAELTAAYDCLRYKRKVFFTNDRGAGGVKGSCPSASQVAAQIAASPPTIYRGRRRRRRSVGWCYGRPVGRHCRACELRCQRGACDPKLLHITPSPPR